MRPARQVETTFFDDLIVVSNTTNSTLVCENKSPFINGGTLMLIGAPAVRTPNHPLCCTLLRDVVARAAACCDERPSARLRHRPAPCPRLLPPPLPGGPQVLLAQVMVLLSYNVVTEVALRHMKDFYREKEPLQEFNQSGPDPDAMARARMAEHAYSGKRAHGPGDSFNNDLRGGGGFGAGYPDIESERGRCESTQL